MQTDKAPLVVRGRGWLAARVALIVLTGTHLAIFCDCVIATPSDAQGGLAWVGGVPMMAILTFVSAVTTIAVSLSRPFGPWVRLWFAALAFESTYFIPPLQFISNDPILAMFETFTG
jgi:hypothetical protein